MDNKLKIERIKELNAFLNSASDSYYNKNAEIIPDFEYDRLYDELRALEAETGAVYPNSPTLTVGYEVVEGLEKVRHGSRMLSLDKTKDIERLKSFLGEHAGLLSWKLDGLTVVIRYENGGLFQAITRGNGEIGEDVTHNARVFRNLPHKVNFAGSLVIRGEAVISFSEFEKLNETLEPDEKYKNPRNLCSGSVRQLNSEVTARRNVDFIAFSLVEYTGDVDFGDFKSSRFGFLGGIGFETVETVKVTAETVASAVENFKAKTRTNGYATDGLVLTFDSISYGDSLGRTSKFPRDSIAYKWADETGDTVLREIEWNTSRTGLINPVAVFDPVEIEGSKIARASLHNIGVIELLELGVGDVVRVYKANMIIPQILENLTKSGAAPVPEKCPVCESAAEIEETGSGRFLICPNPNCRAQIRETLAHFASRDAMNIEGFSIQIIDRFIEEGFLNDFCDIYALGKHAEEIAGLKGFGEKSRDNILNAVEKSRNVILPNFINALSIKHVGLSNAKTLCNNFENDLDRIRSAPIGEMTEIDGVGERIANSVFRYFSDEKNLALLDKILPELNIAKPEITQTEQKYSGLTFVITGEVTRFKNRNELKNYIEANGGKATGSVTKKTDYLINNDIASNSAKNKAAKELGIPIITEEKFLNL